MTAATELRASPRSGLRMGMDVLSALEATAFLLAGYLLMTVGADWRYSVDLQVLNDVVSVYPFPDDLLGAVLDNSALVWLVLKLQWLTTPETLLQWIYIAAFASKTFVLLRCFGLLPALSLTVLLFFSVDLNQARMSIALTLTISAWAATQRHRQWLAAVLVLLAASCHYPACAAFVLFYVAGRHPKIAAIGIVLASLAGIALVFSPDSPALRYLAYLENDGDNGSAFFFIITALLATLYWARLSGLQRLIAIAAIALAFVTRDLVNLSGRVSELAATAILLCAFAMAGQREEVVKADQAALVIAILFFAYRFTQWVLLGQVPLPSNL